MKPLTNKQKLRLRKIILRTVAVTLGICVLMIGVIAWAYHTYINKKKNVPSENNTIKKEKKLERIKYNLAVFGIDKDRDRTDVIFVVHFDSTINKMKILSVPRDTKVTWTEEQREMLRASTGMDVYVSKINEMSHYSTLDNIRESTINQLEHMLNITIDNYVIVDLDAFKKIVDAVDGVTMDVPQAMKYTDRSQGLYIDLDAGEQTLDGEHAEMLVRYRHYLNGDVDRVAVQQKFLNAFMEKLTSPQIIKEIPELVNILFTSVETDMPLVDIPKYYPFLKNFDTSNLSFHILPGEGRYENGKSYFFVDELALYDTLQEVFYDRVKTIPDESTIDKTVTIEILNSTGVAGLAGNRKAMLESEGYQVTSIGNYTQGTLDSTSIYAKDTQKAAQFVSYFPGAKVESKEDLSNDIQIVLGNDMKSTTP